MRKKHGKLSSIPKMIILMGLPSWLTRGMPEAQNAIAHATISAHLDIDLIGEIAEAIGDTKEVAFQGGELDTAKDLLNNTAGRDIAKDIVEKGGGVEDIPEAISNAYRNGDLWIIRNGKIVPSNTSK